MDEDNQKALVGPTEMRTVAQKQRLLSANRDMDDPVPHQSDAARADEVENRMKMQELAEGATKICSLNDCRLVENMEN